MTNAEKLARLKVLIGEDVSRFTDVELNGYLDFAGKEILNQLYALSQVPEDATVPTLCEGIQLMATINGLNQQGAEGESSHSENGITRHFAYTDMLQYVKNNVIPYARVL